MSNVNKVHLIGRMGRDAVLRYTGTGKAVANFSLAVNGRKDADGNRPTTWFQVTTWQGLAETVNQYGAKGRLVYVEGRVELDQFEGQDGQTRSSLKVTANSVQFLDRPNGNGTQQADDQVSDIPF